MVSNSKTSQHKKKWTLTKEQTRMLDSTHHMFLRRMAKNGFRRRISDVVDEVPKEYFYYKKDILKFFKSSDLSEYINNQRKKFSAHIIRQPNFRHTKQLMFNSNKYKLAGNRTGTLLEQTAKLHGTDVDQFARDARARKF